MGKSPIAAAPPGELVLGRVPALQPRISRQDLTEDVMATEDPLILTNLANVVRLWGHKRRDLPDDFAEQLTVTGVARQPLAFVVADAQYVMRTLTEIEEPFTGGPIDSSRWKTDDLFELLPVQTLIFPEVPADDESIVPGDEEVRPCVACQGAGEIICAQCGGAGTMLCPDCSGTRQLVCPRCGGAGTHMGVSGRQIQCQGCRTRGVLQCHRCQAGLIGCTACGHRGRIRCSTCAGHGSLRRRWLLVTHNATRSRNRHSARDQWPVGIEKLLGESDVVEQIQWAWPAANKPHPPLEANLPKHLLGHAVQLCQEVLRDAAKLDAPSERITGLRIRLLGTYIYEVDYECNGHMGQLFVGGNRCRVFSHAAPIVSKGFFRNAGRLARRALHALQTDDRPGLDATYADAVLAGRAHLSDTRCVVPEAAKQADARLQVTESGYRLEFQEPTPVVIDVDLEIEGKEVVLRATHVLGFSHRDRFPKALEITAELSLGGFGRIGLTKSSDGRDVLALVDRPPIRV